MTDARRQTMIALLPLAISLSPISIMTMRNEGEAFGIPVRYFGYAMIATSIVLLSMIIIGLAPRRPRDQSNRPS